MEVVKTVCACCAQNDCGMNVFTDNGEIVRVSGMKEHPYNKGVLCPKGLAAQKLVKDPQRLKYPLKRIGKRGEGRWARISWDEALTSIAGELNRIKETDGPEAFGVFRGAGPGWGGSWVYTQRFMHAFGSPNYATQVHLCFGPRAVTMATTYGGVPEADFDHADQIILWASNPAETSLPNYWRRVSKAKNRGARLVVIDPRFTRTASKADLYVPIKPGTDAVLALGMANVIINEGLTDSEFIEKYVHGFEEYKDLVKSYTPEKVEEITTVSRDMVIKLARMYAEIRATALMVGNGVEQLTNTMQTMRAIQCLPALTGKLAVKGGYIFTPNVGWTDVPLKAKFNEELMSRSVSKHDMFSGFSLVYPDLLDAIATGEPYPIKAVVCLGAPLTVLPEGNKYREILKEKLELLVVHDLYMTSEAEIADYVLPATSFLECSRLRSTRYKFDAYTQHIALQNKAVEPVGESRPDEELFFELGRKLGMADLFPWTDALEAAADAIEPLELTLEDLKNNPGGKVWRFPEEDVIGFYKKNGFNTPTKKVELYNTIFEKNGYDPLPVYIESEELNDHELKKEYPLTCVNGIKSVLYSHTQFRTIKELRTLMPDPWVEIHPDKAKELGIEDGSLVLVSSPRFQVRLVAKLTEGIADPEVIFMPYGWGQAYIGGPVTNYLSPDNPRDPISGSTSSHAFACRIETI
ncbi:MAG: molybdopterin-dependent oxidoreductase [Bacillota bacterium]|nr:molybdopterin-dependent oxidoreductase [Bacillota bacterium]